MNEQRARANGIELAYESFGDPGDETMLLIMGLGTQMIGWDADFCRLLAAHSYHVVRFDNRDCGHSQLIDDGPLLQLADLATVPIPAPYSLSEMAADAAGLLDALGIEQAHVVGASMGGMIAQLLAVERPERLRSLCSMISTTGDPGVGAPSPEGIAVLTGPRPADRAGTIEFAVDAMRVIGSPGYPPDEERVRALAGESFDRGMSSAGLIRQLAAILTATDRTEALAGVHAPTLVIHGREDKLVGFSGGEATARAVPGSRLLAIDGMGHDLPEPLWDEFVEAIVTNARSG